MTQELHPELEVGLRDPLVGGVDEPVGELGVHLPHGEEAVRDRAERLPEPVAVREPRDTHWDGHRPGLGALDELVDCRPKWGVDRRAGPALRSAPHELVVARAEPLPQGAVQLFLRVAGPEPAVDGDLAEAGDDVSLLRGRNERGRDRRRQQRLQDLRGGGIDGTGGSERLGGRRHRADHGGEEAFRLRAELRLLAILGDALNEACRLDECVVRDTGQSSVAAAPVHQQRERRRRLLCGGTRVEHLAAELQPVARPFVHRVLAPHRIGVLLAQPAQALVLTLSHLLVGRGDEEQVAGRAEALTGKRSDRDRARSHLALHVQSAAAPHTAVPQLPRPGIHLPLGRVGEHGVGVREQQQPWPVSGPRKPRDEVRARGVASVELALDAVLLEVRAQQLGGGGLVPGRIDGVDANELLEQSDGLGAEV